MPLTLEDRHRRFPGHAAGAWACAAVLAIPAVAAVRAVADEGDPVASLLESHCTTCHGGAAPEAGIDLTAVDFAGDPTLRPDLLAAVLAALDSGRMPPPEAPAPEAAEREDALARLRALAAAIAPPRTALRRMTRLQYNNTVRDLFGLSIDVFPLPERLMRVIAPPFDPAARAFPAQVTVFNRALGKELEGERHLRGTAAYAQDLRAEHGFDNRADHLSLPPLLMESFLVLARSIVESPDFTPDTVGIWDEFFALPPGGAEGAAAAVPDRLARFLRRAFRGPVEPEVVDRHAARVRAALAAGTPFTDAMKDAATAVLASPRFLYLCDTPLPDGSRLDDASLAARLAMFLWGGLPDEELSALAAAERLHDPAVLAAQVTRMLDDPRLERFCDAFPAQWLQLERLIPAEPDPTRHPAFYFHEYRASMHMMLEPLLVFRAIVVENRPVSDVLHSDFSYRSTLLEEWYRDGRAAPGEVTDVTMRRVPVDDRRFGGLVTTAATMTMTSSPRQTKPITRGAWLASVILADPPPPPPADVPPLPDGPLAGDDHPTIRGRIEAHRSDPSCAGCHRRIDPLGFALENYDEAGVWRDCYPDGRPVDPAGVVFGSRAFDDLAGFKDALLAERRRVARALAAHLLAFATGRATGPADAEALEAIVADSAAQGHRFHDIVRGVVLSPSFGR